MVFKSEWEKASTDVKVPQSTIVKMIKQAFPNANLISYQLIAGGCANLNIKILLDNNKSFFNLRVYLRDKEASYRERNLGLMLKNNVPIAQSYFIGEINEHQFAITEFIEGITLRDLLLSDSPHDIDSLMFEVGTILAKLTSYKFPHFGFLDNELRVLKKTSGDSSLTIIRESLEDKKIISLLSSKIISEINFIFDKYHHLLNDDGIPHLVHGDFDPANILVNQSYGIWTVSGILDWEFAFSNSILWDIANMLRYSHKMPPQFQTSFIEGIKSGGVELPENWHITINLFNILALIDCLKRSDVKTHPARCADIYTLINFILSKFKFISR